MFILADNFRNIQNQINTCDIPELVASTVHNDLSFQTIMFLALVTLLLKGEFRNWNPFTWDKYTISYTNWQNLIFFHRQK